MIASGRAALAVTVFAFLSSLAAAQLPGLRVVYACDSTNDAILRMQDSNCDRDYADPGETTVFYDDVAGALPLSNPVGVDVRADGAVFVCDTTESWILRLVDLDGDGDATGPLEAVVVFDGNANGSGVFLNACNDMAFDAAGRLWIANANAGGGGTDAIIRLEEIGVPDGDWNDAGEAVIVHAPAMVGSVGDSIPADVHFGLDGAIYYLEVGSTGVHPKGIYRIFDASGDGVIQPAEVAPFFLPTPPAGATNQFFWGMHQDDQGTWYLADTTNELIWAAFDADGDQTIGALEQRIYWSSPAVAAGAIASSIWMVESSFEGVLYCAEDGGGSAAQGTLNSDKIMALIDLDGDGVIDDATERFDVYDTTTAAVSIGKMRSLGTLHPQPAYLGNGADVAIRIHRNGMVDVEPTNVHCVAPGDVLTIGCHSPQGTLSGFPYVLLAQPFLTGSPAAPLLLAPDDPHPSVHLDLSQSILVVLDGFDQAFPNLFVPVLGGGGLTAILPPFLSSQGLSVMLELICFAPGHNAYDYGDAPSVELRIL